MTQAPPVDDARRTGTGPLTARLEAEHRREMLDLFRRMIVHQEAAAMLDARAALSANRVLADVLHERAADHRRRADAARTYFRTEGVFITRIPGEL